MGVSLTLRERTRLRQLAREYRDLGYEVTLEPRGKDLPSFLRGAQPDMIAVGPDDSIVVEVKTRSTLKGDQALEQLARRVEKQPGWRLQFVLTNPRKERVVEPEIRLLKPAELRQRLTTADKLAKGRDYPIALVIAWTVLEGTLRHLAEQEDLDSQHKAPPQLLKELRSFGVLSKEQYYRLQHAFELRSQVVHGYSASNLKAQNYRTLTRVARELLEVIEA